MGSLIRPENSTENRKALFTLEMELKELWEQKNKMVTEKWRHEFLANLPVRYALTERQVSTMHPTPFWDLMSLTLRQSENLTLFFEQFVASKAIS